MFDKGYAYGGTFGVAAAYCSIAFLVQWKREKEKDRLGQLTRFQIAMKSFVPGFSFGSEVFLLIGIWSVSIGTGIAIIAFRLTHSLAAIFLLLAIFAPKAYVQSFEDNSGLKYLGIKGLTKIRNKLYLDWTQMSIGD